MINLVKIKNNFETGCVEITGEKNIKTNRIKTTHYNEDINNMEIQFPIDQNDFLYQLKEGDKFIYSYHREPDDNSFKYVKETRECVIDEYTLETWKDGILTYSFRENHPQKFDPNHKGIILAEEDKYITIIRQPRSVKFTKVEKIIDDKHYQLYNSDTVSKVEDNLNLQGESVKYKISGLETSGERLGDIESDFIPDFEHAFLMDGEETFCIKYNPKVQSFKTVIAEQKIETLGGRFPLFVRNGNLNYKEIPISGLIARPVEPEKLELRKETPAPAETITNNSATKFKDERQYKLWLEVWLRNGQPKIFKSAAEGNYIIRLMNVSLQPVDGLSRLLHSFSATGYEIAEYSLDEAIHLGIYKAEILDNKQETPEEEGENNE